MLTAAKLAEYLSLHFIEKCQVVLSIPRLELAAVLAGRSLL